MNNLRMNYCCLIPEQVGDLHRHWCPESEPFVGGDALFTALTQGWSVVGAVFCREFYYADCRHNYVFYFRLQQDDELRRMAVIASQHVVTFIQRAELQVLLVQSRGLQERTAGAASHQETDFAERVEAADARIEAELKRALA